MTSRTNETTASIFGSYEGGSKSTDQMVWIALDCSSQLPLVKVMVDQGEYHVELQYNHDDYAFSHTFDEIHVRDFAWATSGLNLGRTGLQKYLIRLDRLHGSGCPVVLGNHPSSFGNDHYKMLEHLVTDTRLTFIRERHDDGVAAVLKYYEALLSMRLTEYGPTNHWYFTNMPGYKHQPGLRFDGKSTPDLPLWLGRETVNVRDPKTGLWLGRVTGKVTALEAKDRYHNLQAVECTIVPALLWERANISKTLGLMFNNEIVHSGKAVPSQTGALLLHVELNVEDENMRVKPPTPTPVQVQWWDRQRNVAVGGRSDGIVVDQPTDSDFVILVRSSERANRTQWRHFTLEAKVDMLSLDRMITAVSAVVQRKPATLPEGDECGSFDLHKTMLAHGPEVDPNYGEMVYFMNLVPREEREAAIDMAYRVRDAFTLDASQAAPFEALIKGFLAGVMLIQGPPGTGKTRVNACVAIAIGVIGRKVLVTSGSNNGVNALMVYIVEFLDKNAWMKDLVGGVVRFWTMGTTVRELAGGEGVRDIRSLAALSMSESQGLRREEASLTAFSTSAHLEAYAEIYADTDSNWRNLRTTIRQIRGGHRVRGKEHIKFAQLCEWGTAQIMADKAVKIVGSTLNNCAAIPIQSFALDALLIDEAAHTLEGDVCIALLLRSRIVIFTGDHKQLPPTVLSLQSGENPFARQLAKPMFTRLLNAGYTKYMLKTNYRMHPDIARWPNQEFYDRQLENAPRTLAPTALSRAFEEFCNHPQMAHGILRPLNGQRRIFINVASISERSRGSSSWHNKTHLALINTLVQQLLAFAPTTPDTKKRLVGGDIVIVTPYRDQKSKIISSFIESAAYGNPDIEEVRVSTVDGYQGLEADIVIVDLTAKQQDRAGEIGFLGDGRRLNVALTRAKVAVIAVGNMELWQTWIPAMVGQGTNGKAPAFGRWLQDVLDHGSNVNWPAGTLLPIAASAQGNAPPGLYGQAHATNPWNSGPPSTMGNLVVAQLASTGPNSLRFFPARQPTGPVAAASTGMGGDAMDIDTDTSVHNPSRSPPTQQQPAPKPVFRKQPTPPGDPRR